MTSNYVLVAPLVLLTAVGCRNENTDNQPDLMMTSDDMSVAEDLSGLPADLSAPDLTGADLLPPPPPADFFVVRVGDGTAALTSAATAAFLERRKLSDGSLVGTALALPTTVSGTNRILTMGGSSTGEGGLSRSVDGRYLLVAGYDAAVGTAAVAGTASTTTNRVIGRIDSTGTIDTSTAADFLSGNSIRSASSNDGKNLWAAGAGGIFHTTFGSTAKPTSLLSTNFRWLHVFGTQLYGSSGSGTNVGINSVGNGTPMTTSTATLLSGFAAQTGSSHYGFVGFDTDGLAGIDILYVADDRAAGSGGGIQRWKLNGATWTLQGTMAKSLTAGVRGLTGYQQGNNFVLFATTAEVPARIVRFTDDGTAIDMLTPTALATASNNTAYRGIALAPQ